MHKNKDLKSVELTDEQLSSASGGYGGFVVLSSKKAKIDQDQFNHQTQKALNHGVFNNITQTQANVQNQAAAISQ